MSTPVKASVLYGAKDLQVTERALRDPGPDEVQVAVKSTGLCGSDLHYFKHYRNGDILVREPITLGHESAGIVTAVGTGVGSLQLGDQVALEVGQPCEQCDLCTKGRYNICKGMRFRSSAKAFPHAQGTLQEEIVHPARYCHKLPPNVSLEQGALVEPLSVALHASDRAQLETGSTVLVIGAGTVGLLVAAVCKLGTKGRVLLADINHDRLIFARANNFADMCFTSATIKTERPDDQLANAKVSALEMTEDKWEDGTVVGEFDAVFECTGIESCLQTAIYATKPGGKVMLIGMGNPVQTLPISAAALREVDLIGVFRYANTYPRAIELLANHAHELPDLSRLITHRFHGMENIPSAFEMAARTKDDEGNLVIKVNVTM